MPVKTNYQTKGEKREAKRKKRRYGMKVDGRSVLTIQEILRQKADNAKGRGINDRRRKSSRTR